MPNDGMCLFTSFCWPSSDDLSSHIQDDVLKARLKTVGVSEYKFEMEVSAGRDSGTEWRIVDVGGSRSQVTPFSSFIIISIVEKLLSRLAA